MRLSQTRPRASSLAARLCWCVHCASARASYAHLRWISSIVFAGQIIRYPERHFVGAVVILTALSGVGLSSLIRTPPGRRLKITVIALACVFAAAVCLAAGLRGTVVGALTEPALAARIDVTLLGRKW